MAFRHGLIQDIISSILSSDSLCFVLFVTQALPYADKCGFPGKERAIFLLF